MSSPGSAGTPAPAVVPDGEGPAAVRELTWTGERCLPWIDDLQVVYEHYHRYAFVRELAAGKDVLDLGSGEGYGAAMLAAVARSVTGVELEAEAVHHANRRYPTAGLEFRQGSMLDPSVVAPASADLVVCLEALEHVEDHAALIAVVTRALRPGGLLVVSTPERVAYNDGLETGNPFHVHELTRPELEDLLRPHFAHVALFSQHVAVGSLLSSTPPTSGGVHVSGLTREGDGWTVGEMPDPGYLVALASARPLPPVPGASVLLDPEIELVRSPQRRIYDLEDQLRVAADRKAEVVAEREALRASQADSEANREALRVELVALHEEVRRSSEELAEAVVVRDALRRRVDHLEGRVSYRAFRAILAARARRG